MSNPRFWGPRNPKKAMKLPAVNYLFTNQLIIYSQIQDGVPIGLPIHSNGYK